MKIIFAVILGTATQFAAQMAAPQSSPPQDDARKHQLELIRAQRAEVQAELEAAERRLFALQNATTAAWIEDISAKIRSNWERPSIEETGTSACVATIQILDTGEVKSVAFDTPCKTRSLETSIEAAIIRSSPLPLPSDPSVFHARIVVSFFPRDEV